ncbi:MAG: sulfatase [Planctomycetota bacterium]
MGTISTAAARLARNWLYRRGARPRGRVAIALAAPLLVGGGFAQEPEAQPAPEAEVAAEAQATRRPNILLLVTDDQRWDALGCAGNPRARTPHMDALAQDGVRFRNAFVTTSICAASRATILTGLYERTHKYTFGTPPMSAADVAASYPAELRRAGYRTGFVGKFGVRAGQGGSAVMFDSFAPLSPGPYWKAQPDGTQRHLTDLTCDRALEFLDGCDGAQPWCLSISFNAPHAEDGDPQQYFWPAAQDGWYDDVEFPVPRTMTAEVFAAAPEFVQRSESRRRFHWRFDEPRKYQEMVRGYYRMISGVDAVVGRLRGALAARGLADDTVIVFCSDNGYFLGERGFAGKWYAYEPSVRIPLIVMDPRLPALRRGGTCDLTALNVDLAPTILEYAGVAAPSTYQGRSLVPLARGVAPVEWRTEFFYEHLFDTPILPKSEGLRTERFTYIRWFESDPIVEELYDHQADFDEVTNLVGDPSYAVVLADLRARADTRRDELGGPWSRPR